MTDAWVHPIEKESYELLHQRVDLDGWSAGPAAVAARVIHATADPSLLDSLAIDEAAVNAGVAGIRAGAPILCDVEMVRSGISAPGARCLLGEVAEQGTYPSRSAAAMARALDAHPVGAIVVVGCAPTALAEVTRQITLGTVIPALVVGVPVGFVGAAESKEALLRAGDRAGVPTIALRGERGGAAVGAAIVNALVRLARASGGGPGEADQGERAGGGRRAPRAHSSEAPAMLLIGHGSRSSDGVAELSEFVRRTAAARPEVAVRAGFIEFVSPDLDQAVDSMASSGVESVVAVPLVLLGAGHLKDDGPAALARARERHRDMAFTYARDLGLHPAVLDVVSDRIGEAAARLPGGQADAVVVVGRGSTDPDANADLAKAARLLADGRRLSSARDANGPTGTDDPPPLAVVEPAFVSLARPGVRAVLERCRHLGARRIAVVPWFLFTGVLVERIADQVAAWGADHADVELVVGRPMGVDPRLVQLAWERYDEAHDGPAQMNCDGCLYRTPFPGYEHRVGAAPLTASASPGSTLDQG